MIRLIMISVLDGEGLAEGLAAAFLRAQSSVYNGIVMVCEFVMTFIVCLAISTRGQSFHFSPSLSPDSAFNIAQFRQVHFMIGSAHVASFWSNRFL